MCGISGIINKSNYPITRREIEEINNMVFHRGPDSEGFFFEKNFAFGHRRLSIIDLSKNGHQPMTYLNKYTITYNGAIYNYIEIRKELQKLGYSFKSESDTEVILASYDYYGIDCVSKFNGMWAFALFDKEKEIIFCSRDRFGVKPFYYTEINDKFVFGSELKQLLKYHPKNRANLPILLDYLIAGFEDHTNETFFQNIYKLEQSHNLIYNFKNHAYTISKYYDIRIDYEISKLSELDSVALYKDKLYDSVKLRLRSDVKVGTCLSGGLDSSSVATIASAFYKSNSINKFTAITAKSIEQATDESCFAEIAAQNAGLDWRITIPKTKDFSKNIEKIISIHEEPFGSLSVFMQYKVFEKAKENGCIVMLDGQGGDETLLGYERYYPAYLLSLGKYDMIREFFASSKNSRLSQKELLLYLFYFTNPTIRVKRLQTKYSFINKEYFNYLNFKYIEESSKSYNDIVWLQKLEIMQLQLPHLLRYEDRNSMNHSIESRLPFIDYRLVETALSINNHFKIKGGWTKYLLRKSVEDIVPSEISWRRDKLGFNAPEKIWMKHISESMKNQIKKSEIFAKISNREEIINRFEKLDLRTQWRLYNIAKWEELFNVGID